MAGDAAPLHGSVFSGNERFNLWRDQSYWEQEEEGCEADGGEAGGNEKEFGHLNKLLITFSILCWWQA